MRVIIPRWVAYRVFQTEDCCRVAISNERAQEFLTLEDASGNLWSVIANNQEKPLNELCESFGFPLDEVQDFVSELICMGLLVDASSHVVECDGDLSNAAVITEANGDALEAEVEFQEWAKNNGFLWSTLWEMTYRCNESCLHCYNPGASHNEIDISRRGTNELKPEEWKKLLSELKDIGVFRLTLSGGEALLRGDFFDVLAEAKNLSFSVNLMTNGLLIDAEAAEKIAANWPHRVELSIYSLNATEHDSITRVEGSLEKTVEAAALLRAKGINVMLKMVVTQRSHKELEAFRRFAEGMGCESVVDATLSTGNDGSRDTYLKLAPDSEGLIKFALDENNPLWCGTVAAPRNVGTYNRSADSPCSAGHSTMAISPEGNIYPCVGFPLYVGSQREEGIQQVWQASKLGAQAENKMIDDPLSKWQQVVVSDFEYCGKSERCIWCQKCAGMSFLESGKETAPSTIKCRNAAARMIAHTHLSEGGSLASLCVEKLDEYRQRFSGEKWLWNSLDVVDSYIDVSVVKATLRQRTKQRVLMNCSEE